MRSIGLYAQVACIWEATARKPGNVHRFSDFDDSAYTDFLLSAAAIAPVLEAAPAKPIGKTVLQAVQATQRVVRTNTNLGIVLLLAPLAAVPLDADLREGLHAILQKLDISDAQETYNAIRLASPAGLGRVDDQDVSIEPTKTLREVMALAADRDLVARQYVTDFRDVFEDGIEGLRRGLQKTASLEGTVIYCCLHLMAHHADSLIARKRGSTDAEAARDRARRVLAAGWPREPRSRTELTEFDGWLRSESRGRNPGTSADLVAASLFVALREGIMTLPPQLPWSAGADHV
jgi:triphosphoribosyl-dephospho-CoA synthase